MSIDRIDHEDGRTTFALPSGVGYTLPPVAKIAQPETEQERVRREGRAIIENQRSTIPADGNIGPSRHGGPTTFAAFQRKLVQHGLAAVARNLTRLREIDDDTALGTLALDLARWQEEIR